MFDRLVACADVEEHVVLGSSVGFLALHGGIEPGTEGIARTAAARTGGSAYVVTQPRSRGWHVPSHRIDTAAVPALAAFLAHVDVVVSVHGYYLPDQPDAILVGGGRRDLAADLAARLRDCVDEMPVVDDLERIPRAMRGVDPRNPVNRSRAGGVQLELPHRARLGAAPAPVPTVPDRITTALIGFAEGLAATGAA